MVKYAIVGALCALVGGLAGWVLRPHGGSDRQSAGVDQPTSSRRVRAVPDQTPPEQAALAECKRALVQQRAELRLVRDAAARLSEERLGDDEDGIGPSGGPPSPPQGGSPLDTADSADAQSERQRSRQNSQKVRDTVVDHLGVTEDEQQVIKDLVCPQRDNVRELYGELGEGRMDAAAFVQALSQERTLANEGLRRSLGSRRYRQFRQLGAIGLLAPVLCKKR